MSYYEIEWHGRPELTLAAGRVKAGKAPRGGRHVKTLEQAQGLIARYLKRCGSLGGTVDAAHSPRPVKVHGE